VITALSWAGAAQADAIVVVACDLPHLTAATIASLLDALDGAPSPPADAAVAVTDRRHPTCAVWRRTALHRVRNVFIAGERRLGAALAVLEVVEVAAQAQDLDNVNTPGDLPQ
jgi:molybdopterin-guanine dinucleotide biosynthesis protein A